MSSPLGNAPPYAAGPPPRDHRLSTDQDANVRWLVGELGRNGLSGYFRRGALMVECDRIGEDGYRAAPTVADPFAERQDDNGPATPRSGRRCGAGPHYRTATVAEVFVNGAPNT